MNKSTENSFPTFSGDRGERELSAEESAAVIRRIEERSRYGAVKTHRRPLSGPHYFPG